LLAVFTTRDVEPWEELCFSYYGDIDVSNFILGVFIVADFIFQEKREIIEEARKTGKEELVKDHAVYARCHCEADNCIGRLFS
jgi:histone-lysine N-methyltransferase SUV39H